MTLLRLARLGAVVVIPVLLVGLGLFARLVAGAAWGDFTRYETPFWVPPVGVPPGEPRARTVVLVLMDGLGERASRGLPFLDALRARGADYDCVGGQPSLSLPGRAVLLSGAWPEVSGQLSNYNARPLRVDHLFAAAQRQEKVTALAAGRNAARLFASTLSEGVVYTSEPETAPVEVYERALERQAAQAEALLDKVAGRPGLVMVELTAADNAGHGWGAASEQYRRAAVAVDAAVRRLAARVDLERDALVVTADHGHVAAGGHGGPEPEVLHVPLVMAGAGVRAGARGACRQVDVAPTLSVLLGLPVPGSNQGRPLIDALLLDEAGRRAALRAVLEQRERFVATYLYRLATLEEEGSTRRILESDQDAPPEGESALLERLDALDVREAQGRTARAMLEAEARAPWVLGLAFTPVALAGLLVAVRAVEGRELGRAALAAAGAVVLYHAALPLAGLAYSLTAVNKDEELPAFFARDMALGLGACAVGVLAGAWRERRRSWAGRIALARHAWLVTAGFAYAFVLKAAAVFWDQGASVRWRLGDMGAAFAFYLDLLVVLAVGLSAPLMAFLAWLTLLDRRGKATEAGPPAAP